MPPFDNNTIPSRFIPTIEIQADAQLSQMTVEQLLPEMEHIKQLIAEMEGDIRAAKAYSERLRAQLTGINDRWKSALGNANLRRGKHWSGQNASIMSAKISIRRSLDWAIRKSPPRNWLEAKERAIQNAIEKYCKAGDALPQALLDYVVEQKEGYEKKRRERLGVQVISHGKSIKKKAQLRA